MKSILWVLVFAVELASAQKLKKADKAVIDNLQQHVTFLADDKLEGRRTGTKGEKLAAEYIRSTFESAGFTPKGENGSYLQAFEVNDGKEVSKISHLIINDHDLKLNEEYFPFSFSPNQGFETTASVALHESGNPWFLDIKELVESNKTNPHFDLVGAIKTQAADAAKKGANAFFIYNSSELEDGLKFEPREKVTPLAIPVIYIAKKPVETHFKDETASADIKLKVDIQEKKRTGNNVIGFINNNAANTIIIGAHYDHLGYGEDHNSLFTGNTPAVHNGADDNASGTAAMIELGKLLKASKVKTNNYLLIAFSGEELGLFGSKYFTEHPTIDLSKVNYMVNLDMVGRLKDSTRGLNIGGYGTSPAWGELITPADKYFKLKFDSSGTGPSDHTSFYRKDVPVLFFFTGIHSDYHKPSDDADKVNYPGELQVVKYIYALIEKTNKRGKLPFSRTREVQMNTSASFKVTLGIMPDYTFTGAGVRVDGISEGKIAQKAGLKAGDVITQLNDYKFGDVQGYMQALNKFNKGDAAKVKVKRGSEELNFDVIF
ncbi:MAG: M28 family peptidase [Ferruginibacter sp.]|nr:M28 family peptidase [Ferruginibacter sp.]